jgi:hypothetical protein
MEKAIAEANTTGLIFADDCSIVISPVKKKQKSNDHTRIIEVNNAKAKIKGRSRKATSSVQESMLLMMKEDFAHILHGLCDSELLRIGMLTKDGLMKEIDSIDGEYHKSWTKPVLLETVLRSYVSVHAQETQSGVIANHNKPQNIKAKVEALATGSNCRDDRMSDLSMPELCKEEMIVSGKMEGAAAADNSMIELQRLGSDDSDDAAYASATDEYTQSLSQTFPSTLKGTKVYEIKLVQNHPPSDAKPPRVSPTTVPIGIVSSAKKKLLSSHQKQPKLIPFAGNGRELNLDQYMVPAQKVNIAPSAPTASSAGLELSRSQLFATVGQEELKAPTIHQGNAKDLPNVVDLVTNCNANNGTGRMLNTPAYCSNSSSSSTTACAMSKALQKSKEARQAQVALIKEKVNRDGSAFNCRIWAEKCT